MPNSIREQILQAVMDLLAPVAAAAGANLLRSPTTGVPRQDSPALLLFPESEAIVERLNDRVERALSVRVVALARGDTAFADADQLLVAAHSALMAEPGLGHRSLALREVDCEWDQDDADAGAAALPARYQIHYRTFANDLTRQG